MKTCLKTYVFLFYIIHLFLLGCADKSSHISLPDSSPINESPSDSPEEILWTLCAQENQLCLFDGTATVRYGYGDIFITRSATHGMKCSNAAFGADPVPGVVKFCQYSNLIATPPIDNEGWLFCANENGFCGFNGEAEVRYGRNSIYFIRIFNNGIGCNNRIFGDPLVGVVKKCEYRPL